MKTLDEVIRWYENRQTTLIGKATREEMQDSVVHYLKEYRDHQQRLLTLCDNYGDAIANCEIAENKYRKMEDELNDIRREFIEQMKNEPLTWDELRQMEGKPVWIDSVPLVRRWVIIKKFHPIGGNKNLFDMEVEDGAHFLRKNMKRDDPAWWQAYRKERE